MSLTINRGQLTPQTQRYLQESTQALRNYRLKTIAISCTVIAVMTIAITVFSLLLKNTTDNPQSLALGGYKIGIVFPTIFLTLTLCVFAYLLKRHPFPIQDAALACKKIAAAQTLQQFAYADDLSTLLAYGVIDKRHATKIYQIYADNRKASDLKQTFDMLPFNLREDVRLAQPHTTLLAKVEADFHALLPTIKAELPDPVTLMVPTSLEAALPAPAPTAVAPTPDDPDTTTSLATQDSIIDDSTSTIPSALTMTIAADDPDANIN